MYVVSEENLFYLPFEKDLPCGERICSLGVNSFFPFTVDLFLEGIWRIGRKMVTKVISLVTTELLREIVACLRIATFVDATQLSAQQYNLIWTFTVLLKEVCTL